MNEQPTPQLPTATVTEMSLVDAERRLNDLEARRRLVLRVLNVTDVARFGDALAKNKYAAEKLHHIFGGSFELLKDDHGKPILDMQVIEGDPDVGSYRIYTVFGRYTLPNGQIVEQMGSFSTKDEFFAKTHEGWRDPAEISLVDILTAAQTECYKKCIFRNVGLGYWTEDEAAQIAEKAHGHDFGARAGGARDDAVVMKFGNRKSVFW